MSVKKIEELGISPMPWKARPHTCKRGVFFGIENDEAMVCPAKAFVAADAHLIAAAPELYECLREAVAFIADNSKRIGADCDTASFVSKCRAALAKAAGEEAK